MISSRTTSNDLYICAILELLSYVSVAALRCRAIPIKRASSRTPFISIPTKRLDLLKIAIVRIWMRTPAVCTHPPPLQCALFACKAGWKPVVKSICGTCSDGVVRLHQHSIASVRWRKVPITWVCVVIWLTITPAVVWFAIVVHLLRADTMQYVLVQARFLVIQPAHRRIKRLIAQTKHKMTFVMSCHSNIELNLLPCMQRRNWACIPSQEIGVPTAWHR